METTKHPAQELSVPEWLNEEFLEELVKKAVAANTIKVQDFKVTEAVKKGENYFSRLLQLHVKFIDSKENICYKDVIIKILPPGEFLKTILINIQAFEREKSVYGEMLPFLREEYKRKTGKECVQMWPRFLESGLPNTLILEDLKSEGFKMANRLMRLDTAQAHMVMKWLGRFHGMTRLFLDRDHPLQEVYYNLRTCSLQVWQLWLEATMCMVANKVKSWQGFERFYDKILSMIDVAKEKIVQIANPKFSVLPVISHGDCWTNNIMFLHDSNGKVIDVRLLDYQMCELTSPALDLLYFLYTSVRSDIRQNHWLEFLESYRHSLNNTLIELKRSREIVSRDKLLAEVNERQLFGFIVSTTHFPPFLADPKDAPNVEEMREIGDKTGRLFQPLLNSERYRIAYQDVLIHFENIGVI